MREHARAWRSSVADLEVLHATYHTHRFSRHAHEEFCLGIIVGGVEAIQYRGATHQAPQGSLVMLQPGEGHRNWAAVAAGWSFQVLYLPPQLVQAVLNEDGEPGGGLPFFADPVICDRTLFRQLAHLHTRLAQPGAENLAVETQLLTIVRALVVRHSTHPAPSPCRTHHPAICDLKHHLETHYRQRFALADLSQLCGLSPYYLTRLFREAVGLPPHAYLTYLRITQAKQQLRHAQGLDRLAVDLGFADQSHFTNTFKAWVGVTPGQYRSQL